MTNMGYNPFSYEFSNNLSQFICQPTSILSIAFFSAANVDAKTHVIKLQKQQLLHQLTTIQTKPLPSCRQQVMSLAIRQ